jgi:NADPH:quinone reductase-like Zn-dependent oxidoreductase
VFGLLEDGTYGRHLVAPESALYRVPEELSVGLAATLHCTFGTAWRSLVTVGGLRKEERVLITGANGGVGMAAVQVAARFASEVVAVVRDGRHVSRLRELGASQVVVSPDNDFHRGSVVGIDLALDCVGTPTFHPALKTLRVGGRIAVVGNVTVDRAQLNLGLLIVLGLKVLGAGGATRADMSSVLAAHRERPFLAAIDRILSLEQADEAQRLVRAGGLSGRVVLQT